MGIKIFADAASNLFKDFLKKKDLDIKVMNMHLTVGDKEYNCYDDNLNIEEFSKEYYKKIGEGVKTRTSLISPGEYVEAFEKEVEKGNKIICFTMAKGISGTYNSACIARDEINEKYKSEMVYVVDSITAGFGEGMQAIHACELAKQGKDFDYIKQEAESFKHITRSEFTVDNIKYLISTGRASKALARFINLLKIKIMLKNSEESKIAFAGAVPGRKNSIKRLAKLVNEKFDYSIDQTLYLTHCDCIDETNELAEMLRDSGVKNIEIQPYDLISGSHIGPNSIAVFYIAKKEEEKPSLIRRIIKRKEQENGK